MAYRDPEIHPLDVGERRALPSEELRRKASAVAGSPFEVEVPGLSVLYDSPGLLVRAGRGQPDEVKHLHGILKPELVFYQTAAVNEREADAIVKWFVDHT